MGIVLTAKGATPEVDPSGNRTGVDCRVVTAESTDPPILAWVSTAMAGLALDHILGSANPADFPVARAEIVHGFYELPMAASRLIGRGIILDNEAVEDLARLHAQRAEALGLPNTYGVQDAYDLEVLNTTGA